jgi:protein-S-isoprenylcysteine O-methyltransferase Ste14
MLEPNCRASKVSGALFISTRLNKFIRFYSNILSIFIFLFYTIQQLLLIIKNGVSVKKLTNFAIIIVVVSIVAIIGLSLVGCKQATPATTTAATTTTTIPETTTAIETTLTQNQQQVVYTNTQYGFSFSLPLSWEGYQIIESKWDGNDAKSVEIVETGPMIFIRHPQWTSKNLRQDIPIMILTLDQWDSLKRIEFHIGAAAILPSELGRNTGYVFALPARYNYSFPTGYEEVEKILESNPLKTF